jgi:hypothetical protein
MTEPLARFGPEPNLLDLNLEVQVKVRVQVQAKMSRT